MSKTTRRAVLAAGIASTAAVIPNVAQAKPSRLAEVIAEFERAQAAFHAAIDVEEQAEVAWKVVDRKDPILGPKVAGCMIEVRGRDRDDAYDEQEKAIAKHGARLRRELTAIGGDTAVVDRWELEKTEEAIAAVDQWQARRDAAGFTSAEKLREETCDAEIDAALAILAYRPVSPSDARAKAAWLLENDWHLDLRERRNAIPALLSSLLPEGEDIEEDEDGRWSVVKVEADHATA